MGLLISLHISCRYRSTAACVPIVTPLHETGRGGESPAAPPDRPLLPLNMAELGLPPASVARHVAVALSFCSAKKIWNALRACAREGRSAGWAAKA